MPIAARPTGGYGGLNVESSAAFDYYVQMEGEGARDIDLATLPEPQRGRTRGAAPAVAVGARRSRRPAAASRAHAAGAARAAGGGGRGRGGDPGNPTGMAALTRWTGGRFQRGFDFVNSAAPSRHILITPDGRVAQGPRHVRARRRGEMSACTRRPDIRRVSCSTSSSPNRQGRGGGRGGAGEAPPPRDPLPHRRPHPPPTTRSRSAR